MICSNCKQQISNNARFCPFCGTMTTATPVQPPNYPYPVNYPVPQQAPQQVDDVPNMGLNILSFFIFPLGFILYAIWYTRTPKKAKAIMKSAILGLFLPGIIILLVTVSSFVYTSANRLSAGINLCTDLIGLFIL